MSSTGSTVPSTTSLPWASTIRPVPTWPADSRTRPAAAPCTVIEELSKGSYPSKEQALALISQVPLLPTVSAIDTIVEIYIAHYVMPHNSLGDALHLALTSYHGCH